MDPPPPQTSALVPSISCPNSEQTFDDIFCITACPRGLYTNYRERDTVICQCVSKCSGAPYYASTGEADKAMGTVKARVKLAQRDAGATAEPDLFSRMDGDMAQHISPMGRFRYHEAREFARMTARPTP